MSVPGSPSSPPSSPSATSSTNHIASSLPGQSLDEYDLNQSHSPSSLYPSLDNNINPSEIPEKNSFQTTSGMNRKSSSKTIASSSSSSSSTFTSSPQPTGLLHPSSSNNSIQHRQITSSHHSKSSIMTISPSSSNSSLPSTRTSAAIHPSSSTIFSQGTDPGNGFYQDNHATLTQLSEQQQQHPISNGQSSSLAIPPVHPSLSDNVATASSTAVRPSTKSNTPSLRVSSSPPTSQKQGLSVATNYEGRAKSPALTIPTSPNSNSTSMNTTKPHPLARSMVSTNSSSSGTPPEDGDDDNGERPPLKTKVWETLEDPDSSPLAMFVTVYIFALIALSTISFAWESLPEYQEDPPNVFLILETIAIAHFTLEYALRLWSSPHRWSTAKSPLNIIDLLAIIPYYIELTLRIYIPNLESDYSGFAMIRVIRLARVFRVFKLSKYARGFRLVGRAMTKSGDGLLLLAFLIGIGVTVFSSLMFYSEQTVSTFNSNLSRWEYSEPIPCSIWNEAQLRYEPDTCYEVSPFQSIAHSMWWSIVTMTTVGYGDDVPQSLLGRLVGSATMLSGILVVAFPVTIIGTNFGELYQEDKILRQEKAVQARMRAARVSNGTSAGVAGTLTAVASRIGGKRGSFAFPSASFAAHPAFTISPELRSELRVLRAIKMDMQVEMARLNLKIRDMDTRLAEILGEGLDDIQESIISPNPSRRRRSTSVSQPAVIVEQD